MNALVEGDHPVEDGDLDSREESGCDLSQVDAVEFLHMDDAEAVQERLRKTFSTSALTKRVLGGEDAEVGVSGEGPVELGNVDGAAMIETRVETLKDRLRREVHLVEEHPVAALHGCKKGCVLPRELAALAAFHGQIAAEEVHKVGLVRQVDPHERVASRRGERGDQTRLADSGTALEQDRLWKLEGADNAHGVQPRRRRKKGKPDVLSGRTALRDAERSD